MSEQLPTKLTTLELDAEVETNFDRNRGPVRVTLVHDELDPLAVRAVISIGEGEKQTEVEWLFAREKLKKGVHAPTDEPGSHIHIQPSGEDSIRVRLAPSIETAATLYLPRNDVAWFLACSYEAVPEAKEAEHMSALFDQEMSEQFDDIGPLDP